MKRLVRRCDVLVVGAGASGIAATIAAARHGAQVIMLEKYGFTGGLATAGLVGTICGLYLRGGKTPSFAENPFAIEWATRLMKRSKTVPQELPFGLWVLPYEPVQFILLADEMLAESENVRTIFHAVITSVEVDHGVIRSVGVFAWDRQIVVCPKAIVDCSGEAILIKMAGGAEIENEDDQTPGVVFDILGVDAELGELRVRLGILRRLHEAVK